MWTLPATPTTVSQSPLFTAANPGIRKRCGARRPQPLGKIAADEGAIGPGGVGIEPASLENRDLGGAR